MLVYTTGDNKGMYIDINGAKHVYFTHIVSGKTIDVTSSFGNGSIQMQRAADVASDTDDLDGGVHFGLSNSHKGTFTAPVNPDSQLDKIFASLLQRQEDPDMTEDKAKALVFKLKVQDNATNEWALFDGCLVKGYAQDQVSNASNASNPLNYTITGTSFTKSPISLDDAMSTN